MSKKRLTDMPSAKAVRDLLVKREFGKAAEEARKLAGFAPGPEADGMLRDALAALAEASLERKQFADFNRLAVELEPLALAAGPESILALGQLYLRAARPREIPRLLPLLTNPADASTLSGHWVDWAVQQRDPKSLPEEWQAAYTAFRTALSHYEAKADEPAREALNGIGLGSPLIEWKLWLRGLLAWVAGDDGRALENWARLTPSRLAHRLVAPLRAKSDPNWLADQPALKEELKKRFLKVARKDLAGQLRALLPELAGKKGLSGAYRIVEGLLPILRATHPHLVPQLANVFYHTLLKRGEPGDVDRHTKIFGRPPDDPQFNRLSAQILEGLGDPDASASQWWGYSVWLETQSKWPPLLLRRVQAILAKTMADQVAGCDSGRLIIARQKIGDSKTKFPDVVLEENELLRKAIAYAPDWEEPAAALVDGLLEDGHAPEAIAFAEEYLPKNPEATEVMEAYVEALRRAHRFDDALRHFEKLQKAKPFDKTLRTNTAECVLFLAYQRVGEQKLAAAQTLLDEHRELLNSELPLVAAHIQYSLAKKAKRIEDAQTYRGQLGTGVVAAFLHHIHAVIFKAKPAEKTAASKAYKEALAAGPSATDALELSARYQFLEVGGIEFTGRRALHKGILESLQKAAADPALTEAQAVELVARVGPHVPMAKFEKLAASLSKRFPKNPLFLLCTAELWYAKNPTKRAPWKILDALRKAKSLVRDSTDPAYKLLEDRIDGLLEDLDPFVEIRNMFDGFF